MSEIKNSYL